MSSFLLSRQRPAAGDLSLALRDTHACGVPPERRNLLAGRLPDAAHLLWRRRAAEVPTSDIDDYVALHWMYWAGGTLALTANGQAVHDMVAAAQRSSC
jgi:hypothetical protein